MYGFLIIIFQSGKQTEHGILVFLATYHVQHAGQLRHLFEKQQFGVLAFCNSLESRWTAVLAWETS